MTVHTLVVFLACLALAGCGRRAEDTVTPAEATPKAAEPDAHIDDANMVEVDEGMLRDLRITTRPVESRTGGELVMLLGELAVDQRSYAEVGTPVAARITRLLVGVGDSVSIPEPDRALQTMREFQPSTAFSAFFNGKKGAFVFRLKQDFDLASLYPPDTSDVVRSLDVNVLHKLFLEHILGISEEDVKKQTYLKYYKDINEERRDFDSGKLQIAFS